MSLLQYIVLFFAAMLAGAVNAIAGGGTVISFPGFLFAGLPDKIANASNAMALVPGSLGGAFALRRELRANLRTFLILLVPAIAGAFLGANVLANTSDDSFRKIVPFLILMATVLFAFSKRINAWVRAKRGTVATTGDHPSNTSLALGIIMQFVIAFYGGYFGAGMGILMLSLMSIIGMTDLLKMNAIKNGLAAAINATAVVYFAAAGKIDWNLALFAAVGALIGGYGLARFARRIPQSYIRAFVIVFGCVAAVWMFYRGWLS